MPTILEGIRVIDWTHWAAGPFGTAMLADLGAEVIHVEHPVLGDGMRGLAVEFGVPNELPGGRHVAFEDLNRNKKSMTLDLSNPEGREIIYRLAKVSDVFVTNFRGASKLGLDYQTLEQHNPRLICASVSGFGARGPDKDLPSYEMAGLARSGIMQSSSVEGEPPVYVTIGVGDRIPSIFLAYGVMSALFCRERLGIGQEVSLSQLGSLIVLQGHSVMPPLLTGREFERPPRAQRNPLYTWYKCRDGKWIALSALYDVDWAKLCNAIEMANLTTDPRSCSIQKRDENKEELVRLLDEVFVTKTSMEWAAVLSNADVVFALINSLSDLASDPQVLENEYIMSWDHPVLGHIKTVGFPVDFSRTPATLRMPAPDFGQHTEEVLADVLGYTWDDIVGFRQRGVI